MPNLLADSYDLGTLNGLGTLGNVRTGTAGITSFANTVSTILGFLTILGGLWFMVQLILGAFAFISAGGDKQHLDNAKKRITNAVIGLFLVVIAFAFTAIVTAFFGLDILNLGPAITNLSL